MLLSIEKNLKKIALIFTYFLYNITGLQLFMHIHYMYFQNLVSSFTEDYLSEVDLKKITKPKPQNKDIIYKDELDMYTKFNDYIINHNNQWSTFIGFSKIHLAILIKHSLYMKKNTPVIKVIKNYLNSYREYNDSYKSTLLENNKCPFSKNIDLNQLQIEENKKLHLFMIQTHLMPDFIAECFHYQDFEMEKLQKVA
ncbi:hypothetical protein CPAV1605_256 [seawater metagenome]|uniref:Uncharacterized protein n=1 Tax=seawater metagenome TaxID=1561972 RepID=A0A5E8CH61_9ZZZZ